jgi:hypothetical protein
MRRRRRLAHGRCCAGDRGRRSGPCAHRRRIHRRRRWGRRFERPPTPTKILARCFRSLSTERWSAAKAVPSCRRLTRKRAAPLLPPLASGRPLRSLAALEMDELQASPSTESSLPLSSAKRAPGRRRRARPTARDAWSRASQPPCRRVRGAQPRYTSVRRPSVIARGGETAYPHGAIEDLPGPLTVVVAVAQLEQLAAGAGRSDRRPQGATMFRPSSTDGSAAASSAN